MRTLGEATPQAHASVGRRRIILLAAASLIVPAVQIIQGVRGESGDAILLGACSAVLFVLVLFRLNHLLVDIREHRRIERQLREAEAKLRDALENEKLASQHLRELDALKTSILQAVSHDLRTPLTTILGVALTLEQDQGAVSPTDARDLIGRVARNARKLHRLLTDLLDLERLSMGLVAATRESVDLLPLVLMVVEETEAGDHTVIVEGDETEANVDRAKVERILDNLVTNAVRYTPSGTRIWVHVRRTPEGAMLVVEDEGPGVPPEMRATIFEPFQQGREVVRHSPGVGIGLSLVARFAALHGGRVWVDERAGGGASFKVILPDGGQTGGGPAEAEHPALASTA